MTGEEWVDNFCRKRGLDWDKLSFADQRDITRAIPCTIRCWRVGQAVNVEPGRTCPECGRKSNRYDVISRGEL